MRMMNDASEPQICVLLTIHLVLVLHDEEWIIIEVTEELDVRSSLLRIREFPRIVQAYSILDIRK
jgi:hypothetical protein